MLRAADSGRAKNFTFEFRGGLKLGPRYDPKEIAFEAHRYDFDWCVVALQSANDRADVICRVGFAGKQRRQRNVTSHLNDVCVQAFLAKKPPVLCDIKIDGSNASAGVSDDDLFR